LRRKYSLWGIYKKKSLERERESWSFFGVCRGKQTVGSELFGHEMNFFLLGFENFFLFTEEVKTVLQAKKVGNY